MKLEEEIKQKKFSSEYQKLIINLIYTGHWVKHINSQFLKPYGLTIPQYNLLRILRGQYPNPASVNLLIDRMLDKMSNASRLVERLRKKGLVERRPSEHDRRQADVLITQKGLDLLAALDTKMEKLEDHFQTINKKEAQQLNDMLDKLRG